MPKNQGNCKFCFVFSYISLIEAQYSIKYGKKYRLSEQEILDCSGDQIICDEGFNFAKLDFYIRNRLYLTFENKYPYTGIKNPLNCQKISKNEDKYSSTIKLKVDQLETKPILTYKYPKNCLKSLLIKRGPLGTKIHYSLIDNYKGGIISTYQDNCDKNGNDNHAVTIIGYDYDANTKKHYWIIRNSYGTEWGEGGYFRVEAGSNICGIEENAYHFNLNWDSWCGDGCDQCDYNTQENKLICSSCIKGYLFDSNLNKCYKCIDGCKSCSDKSTCNECNYGYFLLNQRCEKCIKDCKKCNGFYEQDCYEWYFGDYIDEDTFIDDEIKNNCVCESSAINLYGIISLLFLSLLF